MGVIRWGGMRPAAPGGPAALTPRFQIVWRVGWGYASVLAQCSVIRAALSSRQGTQHFGEVRTVLSTVSWRRLTYDELTGKA